MELLDQLQDSEKSSVFWLSWLNHHGQAVETEKKVWIQNFLVEKESGTGKTDFNFKLRMSERPSYELREWMRRDLLVELWETRPKITEKRQEDETIVKDVQLEANGKPVIEKRLRGVSDNSI